MNLTKFDKPRACIVVTPREPGRGGCMVAAFAVVREGDDPRMLETMTISTAGVTTPLEAVVRWLTNYPRPYEVAAIVGSEERPDLIGLGWEIAELLADQARAEREAVAT